VMPPLWEQSFLQQVTHQLKQSGAAA